MPAALPPGQLSSLRARVAGTVTGPDDPDYDEARAVWNGMIDARPAVVVRAASPEDIPGTIALARESRLDLAIRGGGHNVAGKGTVDGGIVLDLGALRAVEVDAERRLVHVQPGATLADIDAATAPHGLAVALGVISSTGVAGLTLGGGVGWLTRMHGLAADNLVGAEVVTADGQTVTASSEQNPDLLWALRGGGGNFGVVSEFTFAAHRLGPDVLVANFIYEESRWAAAWPAVESWMGDLPDELTTITTTLTPPAALGLGDAPVLLVGIAWASDDHAGGHAHLDRLRDLCPPDVEDVSVTPWVQWQSAVDELFPKGSRAYWRNASFDRLGSEVIEVLIRRGRQQRWLGTAFDVHHMGGRFARAGSDHSPFPTRDAQFWVNVYGFWSDPDDDEERTAFVKGLSDDLRPYATGGHYVNFQGVESGGARQDPRDTFGPAVHDRLVEVKRRFDPTNLFHVNHNIVPG